jgi:Bacteriophage Sf6, terminase small subunit-like
MNWALNDPDFLEKYNAARAIQTEKMIDEIIDIADDGTNDYIERTIRGKPVVMLDNEHVQRSKLRVEARLRIAAKLLPKKYGDKPAEVNNNLQIHNHLHITEADLRQIQAERQKFLTGETR